MPRKRRTIKPAIITHETHCVECGYNLQSLNRRDVCPECATPIARSLKGPLLRYAGSTWLARVHRGLWILHRVSVVAMFAVLLSPAFDIYAHLNLATTIRLSRHVIPLSLMAWSVLACAGLWLATTPVPRADARIGLQSFVERAGLLSIPVNTLAWIAFGATSLGPIAGLLTNPLGALGIGAFDLVTSRIILLALAIVTWLQSMLLARWLNRIDERVDTNVRRQPTLLDRINQAATSSHSNPPGASAEWWRGMAKWSPLALATLMIFSAIGTRTFPWWVFALMAFLPLMILITMRRTVRDVGEERAIGRRTLDDQSRTK